MSLFSFKINGYELTIDASKPLSIAIPLQFNGAQPNAYGVEKAVSTPCKAGALVGDTRRGGSCNFEQYTLIPHCNGTHTESVGHITRERISVYEILRDAFILARLVSVFPEKAADSGETYAVESDENDLLITRRAIEKAFDNFRFQISNFKSSKNPKALIVRTLPNDESKLTRTYLDEIPPFFSTEAILFLREIGINHLLVDTPSIDRIFDEGKLSNHRIFWNVGQGAFEVSPDSLIHNTITELIYVPDEIADGDYLLNLQIAPFASDAAPSRPVLFAIK
jgi:kynurenine formamidase